MKITCTDNSLKEKPKCAIFGECGGCQYQDISYLQELQLKQQYLRNLFAQAGQNNNLQIDPITPSPKHYHYRSRIDLRLIKTKNQDIFIGFTPQRGFRVIPAESCSIAMKSISDHIPRLKKEASAQLPQKYRNANLVVRSGDDGRVHWGGIGRRSLLMREQDYLWTEIQGKKVFYSLDTFFQANLSILPALFKKISELQVLNAQTCLYDLYGGVGLFGICLYDTVQKVILIENDVHSVKLARYNVDYHKLQNFVIVRGRVEEELPDLVGESNRSEKRMRHVAIIDPPRGGLGEQVNQLVKSLDKVDAVLYLSCNPSALIEDLEPFRTRGWRLMRVMPFDFFPRTRHLETLVLLKKATDAAFKQS